MWDWCWSVNYLSHLSECKLWWQLHSPLCLLDLITKKKGGGLLFSVSLLFLPSNIFLLYFSNVLVHDRWKVKKTKQPFATGSWRSTVLEHMAVCLEQIYEERGKPDFQKISLTRREPPFTSHVLCFWCVPFPRPGLPSRIPGAETGEATGRGSYEGGHGDPGPRLGLLGTVRSTQRGEAVKYKVARGGLPLYVSPGGVALVCFYLQQTWMEVRTRLWGVSA